MRNAATMHSTSAAPNTRATLTEKGIYGRRLMKTTNIPLTPVGRAAASAGSEAPYRVFLGTSLALGIGGGFMLATFLPLARAMHWHQPDGERWEALIQAHGQLQLVGFGGLFVMGMAFRLLPRFAGRPIAFPAIVLPIVPLVATSLVLRSVAQPAGGGLIRDAALLASAMLLLAAAIAFVMVVCGTLVHRESKAEAVGYFFVFGALSYLGGAIVNLAQVIELVRDGAVIAPIAKQTLQVFLQQYGFIIMFLSGVSARAVPVLSGGRRRPTVSRATAITLEAGILLFAGSTLWAAYRAPSPATARIADAGMLLTAAAFVVLAWVSGALVLRRNRVAAASRTQFLFVRAAFVWVLVTAALVAWYSSRGLIDGRPLDQFELDAIRHALTVGLVTMMIVGMGLLIVPEFAGRRLQHPNERPLLIAMLIALNVATALRVWPAIEGIGWLASTRYWPMSAAGGLASAVVIIFAAMFAQSWLDQRRPDWARLETAD